MKDVVLHCRIVHGLIGTVYKGCIYLSGLHDIHGGTVHLQALLVAMSPLHDVIGIVVQTARYYLLRIVVKVSWHIILPRVTIISLTWEIEHLLVLGSSSFS